MVEMVEMTNTTAYGYALKLLSRKDHSEFQLEQKLSLKGVSSPTSGEVIKKLKENRLLDETTLY